MLTDHGNVYDHAQWFNQVIMAYEQVYGGIKVTLFGLPLDDQARA